MVRHSALLFFCVQFLFCGKSLVADRAGDNSETASRTWLATVSVQRYPHFPEKSQLKFCDNDARAFVDRMREGNRVERDQMIEFRQDAVQTNLLPTSENIRRGLPEFLSRAGKDDTVIVFLSMHGLQLRDSADDGPIRTFLIPSDASPDSIPDSLVTIEWLREQLQESTIAKTVVLILDACHAGGIDGVAGPRESSPLSTRSIEAVFKSRDVSDARRSIYVLTSCSSEQSSLESTDFAHGLFTHWLVCGLDGAADANGDAMISMDELFQFVQLQVPRSAAYLSHRMGLDLRQNPQRFFCGTDHGDVKLLPLAPQTASRAIERLARLVDAMLQHHLPRLQHSAGPSRVGIVEFGVIADGGHRELRGSLGSLGAVSRDLIERSLIDKVGLVKNAPPAYCVVPGNLLRSRLGDVKLVSLEQGHFPEATTPANGSKLDAIVLGNFVRRGNSQDDPGPDRLQLEIQLLDLHQEIKIGRISATILVNEELWALLGTSCDRRQRPVASVQAERIQPEAIETPHQTLVLDHPQRHLKNATLAIEVLQNLPGENPVVSSWLPADPSDPNLLGFETAQGREIQLRLRNQTDEWLAIIVQIDGLNQIGQKASLPGESNYWHCPPRGIIKVDQWLDELNASKESSTRSGHRDLNGRRLLVVSPPESLAGQQSLFDQLGEFRVLVYGSREIKPGALLRNTDSSVVGIGKGSQRTNVFPIIADRGIDLKIEVAKYVIHYRDENRQ